jgi:hypothetical protein
VGEKNQTRPKTHEGDRIVTARHIWLMALIPLLGLSTVPASACKVIGHANGEDICSTTSDAGGKKHKDGSYKVSPTWVKTSGVIQITTSKSANSSRVLVRHNSSQPTSSRVLVRRH